MDKLLCKAVDPPRPAASVIIVTAVKEVAAIPANAYIAP
jgi:hypothetical protein